MGKTMVYKYPGPHDIHGDKFDYKIIESEDVSAAIEDGWSLTTPEAKDKHDDKAMLRKRMEAKATELKIPFDGRTSDAKLERSIKAALAGA